jgi:hypothetical protein
MKASAMSLLLALIFPVCADAFTPVRADAFIFGAPRRTSRRSRPVVAKGGAVITVSRPSKEQLANLGLKGSIENILSGDPTEVPPEDSYREQLQTEVTRYVSKGTGDVSVNGQEGLRVSSGTLLTVLEGPAELTWTADEKGLTLLVSEPAAGASTSGWAVARAVLGTIIASSAAPMILAASVMARQRHASRSSPGDGS